jgi:hypothetical protein
MAELEKKVTEADRLLYLIRIYRAAQIAGDTFLARDTAIELRNYGINIATPNRREASDAKGK